jgi:hypothetical protein
MDPVLDKALRRIVDGRFTELSQLRGNVLVGIPIAIRSNNRSSVGGLACPARGIQRLTNSPYRTTKVNSIRP